MAPEVEAHRQCGKDAGRHYWQHKTAHPVEADGRGHPMEPDVKYLGVTIDRRLSPRPDQGSLDEAPTGPPNQTATTNEATHPQDVPQITASLCSRIGKPRTQAQENLSLSKIVGAPRYVRNTTIHKDLNMDTTEDFIRRLLTNTLDKADTSDHQHVRRIAPQHARPPDQP